MPEKEIVTPSALGPPGPPFSQGVRYGNLVFVAGQTAFNSATGRADGDLREQTRTCLERVKIILEAAGTSMENVLDTTCYLANGRSDFAAFNEEYRKYFPTAQPTRATVQASLMAENGLVEISATAYIPD